MRASQIAEGSAMTDHSTDPRKRQCANCPWKVGADTSKIPHYDPDQHVDLRGTIASPDDLYNLGGVLRLMACHNSTETDPYICVGWAHNQFGPGNNIALRLAARNDPRLHDLVIDGPQHEDFECTLPPTLRNIR